MTIHREKAIAWGSANHNAALQEGNKRATRWQQNPLTNDTIVWLKHVTVASDLQGLLVIRNDHDSLHSNVTASQSL